MFYRVCRKLFVLLWDKRCFDPVQDCAKEVIKEFCLRTCFIGCLHDPDYGNTYLVEFRLEKQLSFTHLLIEFD